MESGASEEKTEKEELPLSSILGPSEKMQEESGAGADTRTAARQVRGATMAGGIFVCLLSYGYFQEKIMTGSWGSDGIGGRDISSVFLVMCNRITSMTIAVIGICAKGKHRFVRAPTTRNASAVRVGKWPNGCPEAAPLFPPARRPQFQWSLPAVKWIVRPCDRG